MAVAATAVAAAPGNLAGATGFGLGLQSSLLTAPYATSYAAPYAASYAAPYASSYAAPYAASYTGSYAAPIATSTIGLPSLGLRSNLGLTSGLTTSTLGLGFNSGLATSSLGLGFNSGLATSSLGLGYGIRSASPLVTGASFSPLVGLQSSALASPLTSSLGLRSGFGLGTYGLPGYGY